MSLFRSRLIGWWKRHKRDFPWRKETDPYRILVAEILLRRTRAQQVVPVYDRFLREFPDLPSLATARPHRVRKLLRPLGLHWRTEDVLRLGKHMVAKMGGRVPEDPDGLGALPGVGEYVTAAVQCFAWGERVPVIDTNTARVVARFFGIAARGELRRERHVRNLLNQMLDYRQPRELNWALIDFAAEVCRARIPRCSACPVEGSCLKTGVDSWK